MLSERTRTTRKILNSTVSLASFGWIVALSVACSSPGDPIPSTGLGGGTSLPSSGGVTNIGSGGTSSSSGGTTSNPVTSGGMTSTISSGGQTVVGTGSGGKTNVGGSTGSGGATAGAAGSTPGGTSAGGSTGTAGASAQGGAHTRDHCVDGYDPDPADDQITSAGPADYVKGGQTDTTVQPQVLSWMQAHVWEEAHFQWHNIRRCKSGTVDRTRDGGLDPCKHTDLVPANQEFSGPGDGLEFLAMHRHMIQSLKQLYPKHAAMFEGWDHFPTKTSDLPAEWSDWMGWGSNQQAITNGAKADDPASHMSEKGFESEGAFGQWIQGTGSGLHGALHFAWTRSNNSDHGLGNQFTNIDNFLFWKMHGWIDKVWDKYRAAKGKTPNDQDIKDAVLQQCRGMDQLALLVKPDLNPNPGTCTTPAPKQTGEFVTSVLPIFMSDTNKCAGCHGQQGAGASLTLNGGDCMKASDVVAAMVNKPSQTGGQFKIVVPGDPDHSWLYLKATGKAATAGCTPTGGVNCETDTMPQGGGGVTLTQAEQDALRKWIMDGAPAPQ